MFPDRGLQAMMCGIPIITNVSPELVSTVDYGIIVEYNDKPEIKKSILRLRDNSDLRSRLGKNARRAFLDKSNWKNVEKDLFLLYKDSLNK